MSKYEMKKFQKKAYNSYLAGLKFIDYRKVIKDYMANPNDLNGLYLAQGNGGTSHGFKIQLDAPTGSGKTVLLGHILKDFHKDYAIVVFSPGAGRLQEQTARRLSEIMGDSNVSLVDESTFSQEISTGVAYVGNWEKFVSRDKKTGDYKNRIVRDGDSRNFFDALLELGNKGTPVIVCIDEAHHGSGSAFTSIQTFLEDIKKHLGYSPLYLEISATPILKGHPLQINITTREVQAEGLIRKNIRLNGEGLIAEIDKLSKEQRASQQVEPFLIDYAIKKQVDIDARYIVNDAHQVIKGQKVHYHSLIGLQIPNSIDGNEALARAETHLRDKYNITRENDQLLVYLSDDNDKTLKKELLKNIASPDSPVKVLIYKQGIATGWDCPRAQILLGFRHITSKIFTKQNLGRFVRTTEQKYYGDDELDYTYVISNVGDLGQAGFAEGEVDSTFIYEKEAVLRKNKLDGHIALSSFNKTLLPTSHYATVNQNRVPPEGLKNKWESCAADANLWNDLQYTNISSLSQNKFVSAEMDLSEMEKNNPLFILQGESKALGEDNRKQYNDFEKMVLVAILDKGRNYGANAQLARTFTRIIVRWYRELVWGEKDSNITHKAKLGSIIDILEGEQVDGIRPAMALDQNDFAVEQASLDPIHWKAVAKVIEATLMAIPSSELQTEEEFRESGVPWAERNFTRGEPFFIDLTAPVWIATTPDNEIGKNGVGSAPHYAYAPKGDEIIAYREGAANLSGPETSFEKIFIPSVLSSPKNENILAYYMKSPENSKRSYRLGVASLDNSKVSDFYPDYIGEIYNTKGKKYSPWIVEVKSELDVHKAERDRTSLLGAKAKTLVDLALDSNIKAGVAYEQNADKPNAEWVIITKVEEDGSFKTNNLKEYLLR
jgi:superfamily II DNA or RNA helicase